MAHLVERLITMIEVPGSNLSPGQDKFSLLYCVHPALNENVVVNPDVLLDMAQPFELVSCNQDLQVFRILPCRNVVVDPDVLLDMAQPFELVSCNQDLQVFRGPKDVLECFTRGVLFLYDKKYQGVAQRGIQRQPVERSRTAAGSLDATGAPITSSMENLGTRVGKNLHCEKKSGAGQPVRTSLDDLIMKIITCFMVAVTWRHYVGYAVVALLVEINSVFLHFRQLLQICGVSKFNPWYRLNSLINLATFIVFRILLLSWMTRWIVINRDAVPLVFYSLGSVGLAVMVAMNIVLFYRLLRSDFISLKDTDDSGGAAACKKSD
ncbi:tlc domain-containing protein 2 [Plakobranchus ocellatus]|uniref:Tlc domain-containing protein 2 n=1 Tax=Plakobranchus ocellatus TaxID=259542 RepID=A0AAV4DAG6_9GAST|nr:tlc domain-containing protein 2 [Plakobranchus ocellatus]